MLKLTKNDDHQIIKLAFGVELKVRPIDSTVYETERAKALRQIIKFKQEISAIKENGGKISGLPDFNDEDAQWKMRSG